MSLIQKKNQGNYQVSRRFGKKCSFNLFASLFQQLVKLMDEAGTAVHSKNVKVKPPVRIPTPYGGRLVWTLPGKTKIIAHLKDKTKIRHKKRWSQCMYMYYILGYRLMELPISDARKQARRCQQWSDIRQPSFFLVRRYFFGNPFFLSFLVNYLTVT